MIEEARALLAETIAQIERRQYEIARLTRLRTSLEEFIEQPEGLSVTPPAPTPIRVVGTGREAASSSGDAPRPIQPAAAPHGLGAAAGKEAVEKLPRSTASTFPCRVGGCAYVGKSQHALNVHIGRAHFDTKIPKTTFLCSRNCGATFPTREASDAHEREGRCSAVPTRPATKEFRINGKVPDGYVEALGE